MLWLFLMGFIAADQLKYRVGSSSGGGVADTP